MFFSHPRVKVSIVGSLRDREVACSASDRQGSNFESCVWRTVSSQSSHHPQEVLLAQFSLYVHKGGLKPDSFHFIFESELGHSLSGSSNILWTCTLNLYVEAQCLDSVGDGGPHWSTTGPMSHNLIIFTWRCVSLPDPQIQVGENYSFLFNLRSNLCKSYCVNKHFVPNISYLIMPLPAPHPRARRARSCRQ